MDDAQYDVGMFLYNVQCYRSACIMKDSHIKWKWKNNWKLNNTHLKILKIKTLLHKKNILYIYTTYAISSPNVYVGLEKD